MSRSSRVGLRLRTVEGYTGIGASFREPTVLFAQVFLVSVSEVVDLRVRARKPVNQGSGAEPADRGVRGSVRRVPSTGQDPGPIPCTSGPPSGVTPPSLSYHPAGGRSPRVVPVGRPDSVLGQGGVGGEVSYEGPRSWYGLGGTQGCTRPVYLLVFCPPTPRGGWTWLPFPPPLPRDHQGADSGPGIYWNVRVGGCGKRPDLRAPGAPPSLGVGFTGRRGGGRGGSGVGFKILDRLVTASRPWVLAPPHRPSVLFQLPPSARPPIAPPPTLDPVRDGWWAGGRGVEPPVTRRRPDYSGTFRVGARDCFSCYPAGLPSRLLRWRPGVWAPDGGRPDGSSDVGSSPKLSARKGSGALGTEPRSLTSSLGEDGPGQGWGQSRGPTSDSAREKHDSRKRGPGRPPGGFGGDLDANGAGRRTRPTPRGGRAGLGARELGERPHGDARRLPDPTPRRGASERPDLRRVCFRRRPGLARPLLAPDAG